MGAQHIRIADDCGERRLEFMGKSSHKLFLHLVFLLQLLDILLERVCHLIKITRQLSQLVTAHLFCPVCVLSLRHTPCRSGEQADWFGQMRGDKMHYGSSAQKHRQRHPAVQGKAHRALCKHVRDILHGLQIKNSAQCADRRTGMHIITVPRLDDAVSLRVRR